MIDLQIRCAMCGFVPAMLRLNELTVCAQCAHAAIDAATPRVSEAMTDDELLAVVAARPAVTVSQLVQLTGQRRGWLTFKLRHFATQGLVRCRDYRGMWSAAAA